MVEHPPVVDQAADVAAAVELLREAGVWEAVRDVAVREHNRDRKRRDRARAPSSPALVPDGSRTGPGPGASYTRVAARASKPESELQPSGPRSRVRGGPAPENAIPGGPRGRPIDREQADAIAACLEVPSVARTADRGTRGRLEKAAREGCPPAVFHWAAEYAADGRHGAAYLCTVVRNRWADDRAAAVVLRGAGDRLADVAGDDPADVREMLAAAFPGAYSARQVVLTPERRRRPG